MHSIYLDMCCLVICFFYEGFAGPVPALKPGWVWATPLMLPLPWVIITFGLDRFATGQTATSLQRAH